MNERVLKDPEPVIKVLTLADSSVQIAVKPWVKATDMVEVEGDVTQSILETFRARDIVIPYPQRVVRLLDAA